MKYLRISIGLVFLSLLISSVYSQANKFGAPLITNYYYIETGGSEQNWCITQDHRGVVYVGNHDKGVLEYDGVEWRTIEVPNDIPVRSMVTGDDGVVYVGAEGDFGMLGPDRNGEMQFRSLYDTTLQNKFPDIAVWKTYFEDGKVYFCDYNGIVIFSPSTNDIAFLETTENAYFSFFANHKLYTTDWGQGLMIHNGNSFEGIPGGDFFTEMFITGLVLFEDNTLLVSTMDDGIYLFNTEDGTVDDSFVEPALMEEIRSAQVPCMTIHNDQILLGTFDKGLYILDYKGKLLETISVAEGLLDNTITAVHIGERSNGSGQLWLANWKGVSKVKIDSPFRQRVIGSVSRGMSGTSGELISDLATFNNTLFVSTFNGLYYQSASLDNTEYLPVPGIQQGISDLQEFTTSSGKSLLLASRYDEIYVVDKQMRVSDLQDLIMNPADNNEDLDQISGNHILIDPENPDIIYTGYSHVVGLQFVRGKWKEICRIRDIRGEISKMVKDKYGYLWVSSWTGLYRLDLALSDETGKRDFTSDHGLPEGESNVIYLDPETGELLIGSENGFYCFDYYNDEFVPDSVFNSILPQGRNLIRAMHKDQDGDYWFSFENEYNGWTELVGRRLEDRFEVTIEKPFKSLPNASADVFTDMNENGVWFSKSDVLYHFNKEKIIDGSEAFQVLIRDVRIYGDSSIFYGTNFIVDSLGKYRPYSKQDADAIPEINYYYNNITLNWSAPFFENEEQNMYSYLLEGYNNTWSGWDQSTYARFTNLRYGKYQMRVKAKNIYGEESLPSGFSFRILRPWYASIAAILVYIILSVLLIVFVVLYTRNLRNKAEILTKKNREIEFQKAELENLNEEITAQRDEIEAQRDSITAQKDLIDEQKTAMTDSIHYARRIQDAVLPAEEVMRFLLPKHFVFYRPQHIVSGDFFWIDKKDETVLLALGDCTGHGVPGAFMSMLGISLLNEISSKFTDHSTNEIVDELRDQVIASLGQTGDTGEAQDGMDMGMIAINLKTREVQFTGAQHNLYIFRKGELEIVKGDRMPVGIHARANKLFQAHNFKLNRGDSIYLFSDGFPDQFGGEKGKKYSYPRLKTLLTDLQEMIMHDQLSAIAEEFDKWKGDEEQIDDVLMIGIKL